VILYNNLSETQIFLCLLIVEILKMGHWILFSLLLPIEQ